MTKTKYYCKCDKDKAMVEIDTSSTRVLCGIKGVVDCYDVHITKGQVICNTCNDIIYYDKECKSRI